MPCFLASLCRQGRSQGREMKPPSQRCQRCQKKEALSGGTLSRASRVTSRVTRLCDVTVTADNRWRRFWQRPPPRRPSRGIGTRTSYDLKRLLPIGHSMPVAGLRGGVSLALFIGLMGRLHVVEVVDLVAG